MVSDTWGQVSYPSDINKVTRIVIQMITCFFHEIFHP